MGLVSVTCLCLSLHVDLVFVSPQSNFIHVAKNMSLEFYIIKLQQPKRA